MKKGEMQAVKLRDVKTHDERAAAGGVCVCGDRARSEHEGV